MSGPSARPAHRPWPVPAQAHPPGRRAGPPRPGAASRRLGSSISEPIHRLLALSYGGRRPRCRSVGHPAELQCPGFGCGFRRRGSATAPSPRRCWWRAGYGARPHRAHRSQFAARIPQREVCTAGLRSRPPRGTRPGWISLILSRTTFAASTAGSTASLTAPTTSEGLAPASCQPAYASGSTTNAASVDPSTVYLTICDATVTRPFARAASIEPHTSA